jgi:hypothetical protein
MNREVHVRFWERAEVQLLRATRQPKTIRPTSAARQLDRNNRTSSAPLTSRPLPGDQPLEPVAPADPMAQARFESASGPFSFGGRISAV